MPYHRVGSGPEAVNLYYEIRGTLRGDQVSKEEKDDRPKVVMIMGFSCTMGGWNPQLDELLSEDEDGRPLTQGYLNEVITTCKMVDPAFFMHAANQLPMMQLLVLDNRGVGRSSMPRNRKAYTSTSMAIDVLCIMEHLGWNRDIHVVGHSMGGMIATRLAALAPERLASLTLISVTSGGFQIIPRSWRALKYALQLAKARTPEDRAKVDLKLHFMKKTLDEPDKKYGRTRRELLHEEYVEGSKRGGIGQPKDGFEGQLHAVWKHRVSKREVATIVQAQIPVLVLHGRHDILAMPWYGEQLAHRLGAPCIMLEGAHFLTRERGPEVNQLIKHVVLHGRRLHDTRHRYLDINPLPAALERLSAPRSPKGPLDGQPFQAPFSMELADASPAVSRVSSGAYLLTA